MNGIVEKKVASYEAKINQNVKTINMIIDQIMENPENVVELIDKIIMFNESSMRMEDKILAMLIPPSEFP